MKQMPTKAKNDESEFIIPFERFQLIDRFISMPICRNKLQETILIVFNVHMQLSV